LKVAAINVWNLKIINMLDQDFISLKRCLINQKEMCEIEMFGLNDDLVSMIFSAMKSNEQFAKIVVIATEAYLRSNYSKEAILN